MSIDRRQVLEERTALVSTLDVVGPDAPTLAGDWSTTELAQHVAAQDRLKGLPAFAARRLVLATNIRGTAAYLERPRIAAIVNAGPASWDASMRRLRRPPPNALTRHPVATITLWEYLVHHEDVRRPASVPRGPAPDLTTVISWLLRYNRRRLEGTAIRIVTPESDWSSGAEPALTVRGTQGQIVLWLSGRGDMAELQYQGDTRLFRGLTQRMAI